MGYQVLSEVLQFRPNFKVEHLDTDVVFLVGENERFVLFGRHNANIAGLIDGQRTVQEILDAARDSIPESETLYTINRLKDKGYLVPVIRDLPLPHAAFWQGIGFDAHTVWKRLSAASVSVLSLCDVSVTPLIKALSRAGLSISEHADIQMVLTDDYLRPELVKVNQQALENGKPWCMVKPVGFTLYIGPLFVPGAGPCWECLAHRLRNNRPVEQFVRTYRKNDDCFVLPPISTDAGYSVACEMAATAASLMLAGQQDTHPLRSSLFALNPVTFEAKQHTVVRRPQCPVCGDSRLMAVQGRLPVNLEPVEKNSHRDGGYRRQMPWQTYKKYCHHVSPITGAVTYLEPMIGRNSGLRAVYASGYLVCPKEGVPHTNVFDKNCAGKGTNPDQAKTSALCEAIERVSGIFQGDEAVVRGSMNELGFDAVHFNDLQNFSDDQFDNRDRLNAQTRDRRQWIPLPFDTQAVIDWTPAWSLSCNRMSYIPLSYCYAQTPPESGTIYGTHNPNGAAAGNCVEEAVLQGILELIERDAVAVWWYNKLLRPEIDPEGFHDGYFHALRTDYARMGWHLWVLDLTHDLGIPSYAAVARHSRDNRFTIGFGCHLDAHLAVQRALTEVNQLFDPTGNLQAPWDMSGLSNTDFLFPRKESEPLQADTLPRLGGPDLRSDIEFCMKRLSEAGLDLLAVNKTRPDIGLSVVHVIVPGLRHFWPRLGPGRLYTVPHKMDWIKEPLSEKELNPVSLFL